MTGLPLIFCSLVLGTYKINNYTSHQRDTNFGGANSRSAKTSPRYSACRISNEPASLLLLLTDTDLPAEPPRSELTGSDSVRSLQKSTRGGL